jgi:hypothetical protein
MCVQDGRDTCAGCGQVRGVETQMLTCEFRTVRSTPTRSAPSQDYLFPLYM